LAASAVIMVLDDTYFVNFLELVFAMFIPLFF
jgi:hypothetical protein